MKSIRIYRTKSGVEPFSDWFDGLKDNRSSIQISYKIRRLSLGQANDCKHISQGVYELRIHLGPGFRVYFGVHGNQIIVLLIGGTKRSQKRDIKRAEMHWQDYKEQYNDKN